MLVEESKIQAKLDETIIALRESYVSKGVKASGAWGNSLEAFIEESDGGLKVGIKAFDYIKYAEEGRGPNKEENVDSLYPKILQWAKAKGISVDGNIKTFAYFVTTRLINEGFKVPNQYNPGGVISDVINQSWFNEMLSVIGYAYDISVESEILKSIRQWQ